VAFAQGLLLGLAVAVPIGPVAIMCIRRTCSNGPLLGFISGLGAASAHSLYAAIGAVGATLVSDFLVGHGAAIRFAGGIFLLYVGLRIARAPRRASVNEARLSGALSAYVSTALFALSNPMTVVLCSAFFATLSPSRGSPDDQSVTLTVAGAFAGSAAWWLALSLAVATLRRWVSTRVMDRVNAVAGCAIVLFGLTMVGRALIVVGPAGAGMAHHHPRSPAVVEIEAIGKSLTPR
jgi:threonine/homoserine/homoserine lactone efflux protein